MVMTNDDRYYQRLNEIVDDSIYLDELQAEYDALLERNEKQAREYEDLLETNKKQEAELKRLGERLHVESKKAAGAKLARKIPSKNVGKKGTR